MIKVIITGKNGGSFANTLPSKQEAEEWVKNHKAKGKDAQIVTTPNRIDGAKFIEEVDGPMGVKLLKQELPADYTVEYIEEHLYNRQQKWEQLLQQRDQILCATDWLFIADVMIDQRHRKIYMEYRQYLRDIPQKTKQTDVIQIESFGQFARRNYPQNFLEGRDGEKMVKKFMRYVK